MNVRFVGMVEQIIDEAIRRGYAATKTEVLRLGVLELNNKYGFIAGQGDAEDIARADALMQRIVEGKEELISEKDFKKKHGLA